MIALEKLGAGNCGTQGRTLALVTAVQGRLFDPGERQRTSSLRRGQRLGHRYASSAEERGGRKIVGGPSSAEPLCAAEQGLGEGVIVPTSGKG